MTFKHVENALLLVIGAVLFVPACVLGLGDYVLDYLREVAARMRVRAKEDVAVRRT